MKRQKNFRSVAVCLLIIAMLIGVLAVFSGAVGGSGIEVEGAQIRTEGVQGLRFVARVERAKFDLVTGADANFGILLIPQSMIGKGENITVDTHTVKDVKAKNLMTQTEEYYEFTAVLLNIPAEFYGTELVARAYVREGDAYTYSDQLTRSVKYVAEEILNDKDATETDIAAANAVMRSYGEVGNDIVVNVDDIWNGPSVLTAYPEYPEQIARDYMYSVSVTQRANTEQLTVYNHTEAFFYQNRFEGGDVNRRFCEFAFSGDAVTVDVKVNTDFDTYAVVPTSKGFESTYADGVISITMDEPEQIVVILDDDVNTALAIFADEPEVDPLTEDTADIYVSGWNNVNIKGDCATYENGILTIKNEYVDLYIEPGAVLLARIITVNHRIDEDKDGTPDEGKAHYFKISGRGAIVDPYSGLYGNFDENYDYSASGSPTSLVRMYGQSSSIKDVKLLDSRGFNLNIDGEMSKVTNVKILSTIMTSDGITTSAPSWGEGIVKDCFVYCGDNALVTQSYDANGYTFENITIGTTCSAIYPQYECYSSEFNDIYVFRADEGLISLKHGTDAKTVNINNLDALDCVRTPWLFHAEEQGSGEKIITMNKVLMRFTTGEANVDGTVGTSTNSKTLFHASVLSSGSNFTLNMTDLYVGGTLITSDSQVKTTYLSATKNYYSSGNTPAILEGDSRTANYVYDRKVIIGSREVFLKSSPLLMDGKWYLPYDEIAPLFAIAPTGAETVSVNGIKLVSVDGLKASGAITGGAYENNAIRLSAAYNSSVNLFVDNTAGFKSEYDRLYYKDKTPYVKAENVGGTWEYTARSASSDGGLMRMILDVYKQYGAGTYKVTFDVKSSASSVRVGVGVNHTEASKSSDVSTSSSFAAKTFEFTLNNDPDSVNQMALWFKVSSGNTVTLRNVQIMKTN